MPIKHCLNQVTKVNIIHKTYWKLGCVSPGSMKEHRITSMIFLTKIRNPNLLGISEYENHWEKSKFILICFE